MGVRLDSLQGHGSKMSFTKAAEIVKETIGLRQRMPLLWPKLLWTILPIGRKSAKAITVIRSYSMQVTQLLLGSGTQSINR